MAERIVISDGQRIFIMGDTGDNTVEDGQSGPDTTVKVVTPQVAEAAATVVTEDIKVPPKPSGTHLVNIGGDHQMETVFTEDEVAKAMKSTDSAPWNNAPAAAAKILAALKSWKASRPISPEEVEKDEQLHAEQARLRFEAQERGRHPTPPKQDPLAKKTWAA